jgi:hypothetical protein
MAAYGLQVKRALQKRLFFRPLHVFPFFDVFLASPATHTQIPTKRIGMARWRESLFAFLLKNATAT